MSKLPIIPKKFFEVKNQFLPNGKITLSPFTVGLEGLLLQAKDAENDSEKLSAIKQIVQTCIETPGIEADTLPLFVIEDLFLRLRQHSIGEIVEIEYQCTNEFEDKPCNHSFVLSLDLRNFKIKTYEEHTNVVAVHDSIGVKFRYPSIELLESESTDMNDETETIISCIESIFDEENVFPAEDHTREELTEFWKQLDLIQKQNVIENFFSSMPHVHYHHEFSCTKCSHVHQIEFNSVQDVFQ